MAKNLKYTLICFTFLLAISYLFAFQVVSESFDVLLLVLLIFSSFIFVVLTIRWGLYFYYSFFYIHKFSYSAGLNENIYFSFRDVIDQKVVKIGVLHSITRTAKNNQNGYINSIEINDYFDESKKNFCRVKLQKEWKITTKERLLSVIYQLIDEDEILDYDIMDLINFENMLKEYGIEVEVSLAKFHTNKAYSIQKAITLLREALTCDLITLDDFDKIKGGIANTLKKDCNFFDEFIINYLLGAYCFYLGEDSTFFIQGLNKMRQRVVGVKLLLDNGYFEFQNYPTKCTIF